MNGNSHSLYRLSGEWFGDFFPCRPFPADRVVLTLFNLVLIPELLLEIALKSKEFPFDSRAILLRPQRNKEGAEDDLPRFVPSAKTHKLSEVFNLA